MYTQFVKEEPIYCLAPSWWSWPSPCSRRVRRRRRRRRARSSHIGRTASSSRFRANQWLAGAWFVIDSGAPHSVVDDASLSSCASRRFLRTAARAPVEGPTRCAISRRSISRSVRSAFAFRVRSRSISEIRACKIQKPPGRRRRLPTTRRAHRPGRANGRVLRSGRVCVPAHGCSHTAGGACGPPLYRHDADSHGTSVVRRMRVDTGSEDAASDNLVRRSKDGADRCKGRLGYAIRRLLRRLRLAADRPYVIHHAWARRTTSGRRHGDLAPLHDDVQRPGRPTVPRTECVPARSCPAPPARRAASRPSRRFATSSRRARLPARLRSR